MLHVSNSQAADQMMGMYRLVIEKDATTAEINPLVEVMDNGKRKGMYVCGILHITESTITKMLFFLSWRYKVYMYTLYLCV